MVYQAIAEYWISANEEEYDVNVDIAIAGRATTERINFNSENHYTTKSSKVKIHSVTYSSYSVVTAPSVATKGQKNSKTSW